VKSAQAFLLIASAIFYVQSGWIHAGVIAFSILANFFFAGTIAGTEKRGWLAAGIGFNVVLLCFFKYGGAFGWKTGFPLGVSFFTIQQVIYLVDVSEQLYKPAPLFHHALAVSYFPCVSAGPIVRIRDLTKQFQKAALPDDNGAGLSVGLLRLAVGLFKKVVLADSLALVVNAGFQNAASVSAGEAWLSSALYVLQLYLDFSGYCDMAVGIALMMGHTIPENFTRPLNATSITDFWQNWHITLTNFITAYLYTPMVRAWENVTIAKAMCSTLVAMTIAGVWHGSGWQFFIFGLLHGIALASHQLWKNRKFKMGNALGRILTLLFLVLAFLFFRSPDLTTAMELLRAGAGGHAATAWSLEILLPALKSNWRITMVLCVVAPVVCFTGPTAAQYAKACKWNTPLAMGVAFLLLTSLLFMNSSPDKGFIYAGF
jgi:D-alanyl-lipoteichoic acid acyltransferase DltB (MBOAT superfamily)